MSSHIIIVLSRFWAPLLFLFGSYVACIAGLVGEPMGVPSLFRDPPDLVEHVRVDFTAARNSPVWNVFLFLPLLAGLIWMLAAARVRREAAASPGFELSPRNLIVGSGMLSLAAAAAFVVAVLSAPSPAGRSGELVRMTAGLVPGLVVNSALLWTLSNWPLRKMRNPYAELAIIGIPPAIVFLLILNWPRLVPAIAIFALFGVLTLAYFTLALTRGPVRLGLVAVIVAGAVAASLFDGQLRFRVPGIGDENGRSYYEARPLRPLAEHPSGADPTPGVAPSQALSAWLSSRPEDRPPPKLVIVATSGGAYRAGFWTALVLDRLRERAPEVLDDVRLFTGASGGMVGAAYFTALRARGRNCPVAEALLHDSYVGQFADASGSIADHVLPKCARAPDPCACGRRDPLARENWSAIGGDTLSPVAQRFIQRDLWRLWVPGEARDDRGRLLERQWRTLDRLDDLNYAGDKADAKVFDFAELATRTASGEAPSIIFSPTLLDTGAPLLISDLAVEALGDAAKIGVDFFRRFPGARRGFRLSTATRLNATFPFVSPAAALPTQDADRVGDAGYFDNYGGLTAALYLGSPDVEAWIAKNAAGVIVLRLYAFEESTSPSTATTPGQTLTDQIATAVGATVGGFTGPLAGAISTRSTSMIRRNELELAMVRRIYAARHPHLSFDVFDLVAQLPDGENVSLSWYITPAEIESLRNATVKLEPQITAMRQKWRGN
jgi:hypothetical protein